jgi:hypothetical protein
MKYLLGGIGFLVFCGIMWFATCLKPHEVPIFEEIENSETVYVIPLEGDIDKQVKFDSEAQLETLKVATKRILVPQKWVSTGYLPRSGVYKRTVKVIKVDRKPVTREWLVDEDRGTRQQDEGIWVESKDSVSFSTGITISGMVEEQNTSKFLYRYPAGSLADVMDNEIRSHVQSQFSDFSAGFDMSELRNQKVEIAISIREKVIPIFEERGITITTIGLTGGFEYKNGDIQKAIDGVFVAQREKDVNAALLEAQNDKNEKIIMEADAKAEAFKKEANGEAAALLLVANAEVEANTMRLELAKTPEYLMMQQIEINKIQAENWDGVLPVYFMGGMEKLPMMMMKLDVPKTLSN